MRPLVTLAWCVVFTLSAHAQVAPSVSDAANRPGFGDSPILLGRGHIQIESGFMWEHEGADLARTFTWPQLELHAGVARRLQVSLAWDGLVSTTISNLDGRARGAADVRLGAKFGLMDGRSFDAALIAYAVLPVGSESVSSRYGDPQARFAWGFQLGDRLGLSGTADLGARRDIDGQVRAKPAASASLGTTVVKTLNGFAGVIAESPPAGSKPDVWSIEAGLTLPLGVRSQIDLWVSRRVAGGPENWSVGAGVVRRLQ